MAFETLPTVARVLVIVLGAALAHGALRALRSLIDRLIARLHAPGMPPRRALEQHFPKVATVESLVVSALGFAIYFGAVGFALHEMGVSLTAYLATASVLGLAIGFGSQGLVQDVVIGLTLLFSDAFDLGDMIEVGGQIGRVEKIGLRFTVLVNFHGQRVFVPNRNIAQVGRFRRGCIRAYVDVELPAGAAEQEVTAIVVGIARAMRVQHRSILVSEPEVLGVHDAGPDQWRYLRVLFRVWPGQGALVETTVRQRLLAALRQLAPDYPDWKVTVSYRVIDEARRGPPARDAAPAPRA
jgi:moderate conductance mechanosensitive channel